MTGEDALALVREVMPPTPLEPAPPGLLPGRETWLKREDLGPNGAFKWRGALCACSELRRGGAQAVATSSTGNHGAAVAWAAARLGMTAHVVVPVGAAPVKCELITRNGALLHHEGDSLDAAAEAARALAEELGVPFLEDGAHDAQLAGTGTIASELLDGAFAPEVVVVPLACGALAGGVARELKRAPRPPWIVGVQSVAFPRLGALWRGAPDPGISTATSFAGGLADSRIVEPAFGACVAHLDDVVAVSDEELRAAIAALHDATGILVEGAGAAPLAAARAGVVRGGTTVLVLSGGNLDPELARTILEGPR